MKTPTPLCTIGRLAAAVLLGIVAAPLPARAAEELGALEELAFRAATARVAPSVVRIETLGGLERVGQVLFGPGPTTGLVVGENGYIVSSALNFRHRPASILVRLSDGTRKPARLVATDQSRMIVLLKIDVDAPLAVPEFASSEELRVGQWALALGRAFESDEPNVAVGIVSARNRVWGKAVQTDAAVSPNNYGGPLIDIAGRVVGILAPLSPEGDDEMAGYEWYDSGIGFAVHADQVLRALPRLKAGEDLHAGLLGVNLRGGNPSVSETIVVNCHPNSPAQRAGLKAGDKIVEVDGRAVERTAEFREAMARCYAGESVRVTVARNGERFERELELVAKLSPYEHPFLGILPMREAVAGGGVAVRYVYPESPAAKAGVQRGDILVAMAGEALPGAAALRNELAEHQPGAEVQIPLLRNGKTRDVAVTLGRLPESVPNETLPPARAHQKPPQPDAAGGRRVSIKVPEFPNEVWAYLPETYRPDTPHGLVVWLHGPGGFQWDELLAQWKPHCDRNEWILLAPKAVDSRRWDRIELPLIRKLIDQASADYSIDPARIVLAGYESGGAVAMVAATQNRDVIRGVAVIDGPLAAQLGPNEPLQRLAFYVATSPQSRHAKIIQSTIERLREAKYPVTVRRLGETSHPLAPEERAELSRWIDALDQL